MIMSVLKKRKPIFLAVHCIERYLSMIYLCEWPLEYLNKHLGQHGVLIIRVFIGFMTTDQSCIFAQINRRFNSN